MLFLIINIAIKGSFCETEVIAVLGSILDVDISGSGCTWGCSHCGSPWKQYTPQPLFRDTFNSVASGYVVTVLKSCANVQSFYQQGLKGEMASFPLRNEL